MVTVFSTSKERRDGGHGAGDVGTECVRRSPNVRTHTLPPPLIHYRKFFFIHE